jgi:hypothetical protein
LPYTKANPIDFLRVPDVYRIMGIQILRLPFLGICDSGHGFDEELICIVTVKIFILQQGRIAASSRCCAQGRA